MTKTSKKSKQKKAKPKKIKKVFSLTWAFEPFEDQPLFFTKPMFGCLAAYNQGRMVLALAENPGEKVYRGKTYPYDIWDGLLLPTERNFHDSILKDFPQLVPHPVLPKWLYLPMSESEFESLAEQIGQKIAQEDPRFGIEPKS